MTKLLGYSLILMGLSQSIWGVIFLLGVWKDRPWRRKGLRGRRFYWHRKWQWSRSQGHLKG